MEEKSQNASGSASAPKSAESSKPLQQGVGGSGVIPANTAPQVAGGSGQTTVTLSLEAFKMFIPVMKPDSDDDLLLAQMGIVPTPPPAVDVQIQETRSKGTTVIEDEDEVGAKWMDQLSKGKRLNNSYPVQRRTQRSLPYIKMRFWRLSDN